MQNGSHPSGATVELVLTPSPKQLAELTANLERLRQGGAESNTQAIVDAVAAAAKRTRDLRPATLRPTADGVGSRSFRRGPAQSSEARQAR